MKDYRIKITIRNDRLLSAIEAMGHDSVKSFCERYNLPYTATNDVINGRHPPLKSDGSMTTRCKNLLTILGIDVEEAFTKRQMEGFSRSTFETKVEEKQLLKLVNPAKNQEVKAIESDVSSKIGEIMSNSLTPREERVIRMRYGINPDNHCYTLDELCFEFKLTKERVRQIELRALEKFRTLKNSRDLLNTGFYETFTSVNIKPEQIKEANFFANVEAEEQKKKIDYRNQMSKEMKRHFNRLSTQINKQKYLSDRRKEKIKNWVLKVLNDPQTIEAKYFLNFDPIAFSYYKHTWMYQQIIDIIRECKYQGKSYERAEKLIDKLKTRRFILLDPKSRILTTKYFIYYK